MNDSVFRLAIFASGSGTNAEAIFQYFHNHTQIKVALLLTNNAKADVLKRAEKYAILAKSFSKEQFQDSDEVINWLREFKITHIALAGFMWLVPHSLIKAFPHSIINIHPALLPSFGGKGMYGMNVHEAVKKSRETETGITIHEVNEKYDEGKILFQAKCAVLPNDSSIEIAHKVRLLEHHHYAKVIEQWINSQVWFSEKTDY